MAVASGDRHRLGTIDISNMRKIWKKIKKAWVGGLIFLLALNPFVPVLVMAEESTIPAEIVTMAEEPVGMETGSVVAVSESESQVNTVLVDSELETATVLVTSESTEDITPFPIPSPTLTPIPTAEAETGPQDSTLVEVNNQTENATTAQAEANTGGKYTTDYRW